jgi:hypothetical protein
LARRIDPAPSLRRVARGVLALGLALAALTACGDDGPADAGQAATPSISSSAPSTSSPPATTGAEPAAAAVTATMVDFSITLDEDSFSAGTLTGLVLSTTIGLFGFTEATAAALWWMSFWVEAAAVVVLTVLAVLARARPA